MPNQTRRTFLQSTAAAAATLLDPAPLFSLPLGLPLGLQLYSVREMLPRDYEGTLRKVAAAGYQEVEAAGFFNHSPQDVKQAMAAAGLHCVSGHYSWTALQPKLNDIIDFHHQLGADYIICSFPGFKDPNRLKDRSYSNQVQSFTLEDWRWNAEQFNQAGKTVKAAGLRFGYHNHTMEFTPQQDGQQKVVPHDGVASSDGVVPFAELIRLTDPALVTFEMDCGWVTVGGGDPVDYLHRFPKRISMLHIKDFQHTGAPGSISAPPPAAELGRGTVNFHGIFEAAKRSGQIKHYFVEQESFDMPPFEALQIDADYMKHLTA